VSGPALAVAQAALEDVAWQRETRRRLAEDSRRLAALLAGFGLDSHGTALFRWWQHPSAPQVHHHLARQGVWVRLFKGPGCPSLRVGLPGTDADWARLEHALANAGVPAMREDVA
jgi:cobalamin biosynthetic protein CobC